MILLLFKEEIIFIFSLLYKIKYNLILSFIISITGFVFNEFIVLIWCGLERDTYQEISRRSICDKKEFELDIILKDEDIEEEMEENKEDKENKVTIYV